MNREQRDRMTETFAAVSDALRRSAVPMYQIVMDRAPNLPRPPYLPDVPAQTPAEYRAALAKLGRLGIVKVN
jgi:hypothetical protein